VLTAPPQCPDPTAAAPTGESGWRSFAELMNEKIVDFATARLRRQVRKGNVVLASQTEIAAFEPGDPSK
jgi:hypothetical protein